MCEKCRNKIKEISDEELLKLVNEATRAMASVFGKIEDTKKGFSLTEKKYDVEIMSQVAINTIIGFYKSFIIGSSGVDFLKPQDGLHILHRLEHDYVGHLIRYEVENKDSKKETEEENEDKLEKMLDKYILSFCEKPKTEDKQQ